MARIILAAFAILLATGTAQGQIGGATGTATSPGIGGPRSGMSGGSLPGGGTDSLQQGGALSLEPVRPDGTRPPGIATGRDLLPPPPVESPADRSPIGGSAVGGSGVPGTATGDMTLR